MILKAELLTKLLQDSEQHNLPDPLIIVPQPNLDSLKESGSASIDLRLGTWFVAPRHPRMSHIDISSKRISQSQFTKTTYVPFGEDYFLHPRSFVLGVTVEWLCLPKDLAGYLVGKSSWGRLGLIIATATGVHPGFKGCLTLELANHGEVPIPIKPGMLICQLFLHKVATLDTEYIDESLFVGLRKPTLGRVKFDKIAQKLSKPRSGLFSFSS